MRTSWPALCVAAVAAFGGCGGNGMSPAPSPYIPGFEPMPAAAGYTRFITPPIRGIAPGTDQTWCQWVSPPATGDQDVLRIVGLQSRGGHHAVLYATTKKQRIGESHICTEDDMLSLSFLGAIGGEGTAGAITQLPSGLNFRLHQGQALMANVHFINASPQTFDGQAVIDVAFTPPAADHVVADLFANNGDTFTVPPMQQVSFDVSCTVQQDLSFAMVTNHMHGHGISALSEIIHADGTHEQTVRDDTWAADQMFNPRYAVYSVQAPKVAKKGETYHTRCTCRNDSDKPLTFPTEMCAGVGFYFPGNGSIACSDGGWPSP